MKFIKKFPDHESYQAFIDGGNVPLPNVSICVAEDHVEYNPVEDEEVGGGGSKLQYRSTDGNIVTPSSIDFGDGITLKSNKCNAETHEGVMTFSDNITCIGERVFTGPLNLEAITIPDSVTEIKRFAFASLNTLTGITFGSGLTSIGEYAFASCSALKSVVLPNTITSISNGLFDCCSSLTSITIPDTIMVIGASAFMSCSALTSITIPNSVFLIYEGIFNNCSSLTEIHVGNGIESTYKFNNKFEGLPNSGTLYYPRGYSDYTIWKDALPEGWTCKEE